MTVNIERHARHILLKEIGGPGQSKLAKSRIVLIGAGGLGAPAGLYLAAAGVGQITLVDHDAVSLDNLQRQIAFRTEDVGKPKAEASAAALRALDPDLDIKAVNERASDDSLARLLEGADLVLDGTDDFDTRFVVNAAAIAACVPLVSGAVGRWDGQISVFAPHLGGPCYRCFIPDTPPEAEKCSEVGVVGALTGVIGSAMALEAIKLITGAGEPLIGRILIYDGLSGRSRTVKLSRNAHCPDCADI